MAGPKKRIPRQKVVNQTTVAALMGGPSGDNDGIVAQLAKEQAGGDQIHERKHPRRPTEERRIRRRMNVTFSVGNKDAVERIRDLARQWNMFTNNGALDISGVVEHLLLPRLEAAERGEIEPPDRPMSAAGSGKRSENVWF